MSEHRVPVGRKTGGKYVEPVESVGNIISFKLTISANNKKFMRTMKNNKNNTTHKICAEFQIPPRLFQYESVVFLQEKFVCTLPFARRIFFFRQFVDKYC